MGFKQQVAEFMALPKEIVFDLPQIIITGNDEITIENYKNILTYTEQAIRIRTTSGILEVSGTDLALKKINGEHITLGGRLSAVAFSEWGAS